MNIENLEDRVSGQGTLVIRAWTEPGHEHGFRARLTFQADADAEPSMVMATDEEQVLDAVRGWLMRLPRDAEGDATTWTAEARNGQ